MALWLKGFVLQGHRELGEFLLSLANHPTAIFLQHFLPLENRSLDSAEKMEAKFHHISIGVLVIYYKKIQEEKKTPEDRYGKMDTV